MKQFIVAVILSLLYGSAFSQQLDSPGRIAIDQRNYVAEPAARLARCGRMDFSVHLIDVYVNRFAKHLALHPESLRERLFKMSYEQYELLRLVNWPDPRMAAIECAAHTRLALELVARWNLL